MRASVSYLRADAVWQDLDRVRHKKAAESQVVEDEEDEDEDNDCLSSCAVSMLGILRGSDGLDDEGDEHADCGRQEQRPAANLVNEEADAHSRDQLDDGQVPIDLQLRLAVGNADGLQHTGKVVRHQRVTRPLREQPKAHQNQQAMAISRRGPQLAPARLLELLLQRNRLLDLVELDSHQLAGLVALRMVLVHDLLRLLVLALRNQPPRRLRHKPDEHDLEQRRDRLQQARRAPRPVAHEIVRPEADPRAD